MMTNNKVVYPYTEIRDKILQAVDMIADPVRQTLSPKGGNVIFQEGGGVSHTNDGVTIAKSIFSKDPVKNAIINIIKHSSLKTNSEAGDGTTTSIVLSRTLIKGGLKLIDEGYNPIDLKKDLESAGNKIVAKLKDNSIKINEKDNEKELKQIANISSNNDEEISEKVLEVIKFAGEDGMIFIEANNKLETTIDKEPGFVLKSGMFSPELRTNQHNFSTNYKNVPVFLTDKRIYYTEEAESILKTALKAKFTEIVIVAKDFIGQAPNTFIANHSKGIIKVLLVKDTNESIRDLAVYLGGKVITEKEGSLVENITVDNFVVANNVFADPTKTIFTPKVLDSPEVVELVKSYKEELEKNKEDKQTKERIASLTAGTTTIRVGGATPIEQNEKIYRYEDAINATRAAIKDGYLVGGGVSLLATYDKDDYPEGVRKLIKDFTESSVRQIAENCGKHQATVLENIRSGTNVNYGYNALTDEYEDLLIAGVIDPYKVTEMAVLNSISIANVILSSKFLIVEDVEEDK